MSVPTIDLYTSQTPNGIKVVSTLEELGLPYNLHKINILLDTQKEPWYTAINPNGRIPALTDIFTDGEPIRLFESGAIQKYLVERYDQDFKISFRPGTREYHEMNCWLFFLNAGVGPMQGQATHFRLYAPEKLQYPNFRYHTECRRLYRILNDHLQSSTSGFLVGDHCSIADLAHYGWIACSAWSGINIEEFPRLHEWRQLMETRPSIQTARTKPDPWPFQDLPQDRGATETFTKPGRDWFLRVISKDIETSGAN